MKKLHSIFAEIMNMVITVLPIAWILACYDGMLVSIKVGKYFSAIAGLAASCLITVLCLGLGMMIAGCQDLKWGNGDEIQWKRLMCELLALIVITSQIT